MLDWLDNVLQATGHALRLLLDDAAQVAVGWLLLGVALHFIANAVRQRGWWTIIRTSYPEAERLRNRDVVSAYFAGAGLNGVIPARGGDVVKLALIHRRIENGSYSTLAATLFPETLFETAFGSALVVWGLARGFLPIPSSTGEIPSLDVSLVIQHPILSTVILAGLGALIVLLVRVLRRRVRGFMAKLRDGVAILRMPRRYLSGVVAWQALGRLIRLGSLAAFMAAFSLPVTVSTAVLVMAAQGGGRIIPIAPVSGGLRLAMLSYGFVEVTGTPVDIESITAFTVGVSVVLLVSGLIVSLVLVFRQLGTLDPRRAVASARQAIAGARETAAKAAADVG